MEFFGHEDITFDTISFSKPISIDKKIGYIAHSIPFKDEKETNEIYLKGSKFKVLRIDNNFIEISTDNKKIKDFIENLEDIAKYEIFDNQKEWFGENELNENDIIDMFKSTILIKNNKNYIIKLNIDDNTTIFHHETKEELSLSECIENVEIDVIIILKGIAFSRNKAWFDISLGQGLLYKKKKHPKIVISKECLF